LRGSGMSSERLGCKKTQFPCSLAEPAALQYQGTIHSRALELVRIQCHVFFCLRPVTSTRILFSSTERDRALSGLIYKTGGEAKESLPNSPNEPPPVPKRLSNAKPRYIKTNGSPSLSLHHMAVVLEQMLHVGVCRLSRSPHGALLLLLLGVDLLDGAGVGAGGLLADGDELLDDVVGGGHLDGVPHALKLVVDVVVERGVIQPDGTGVLLLFGLDNENLVLALELHQRLVAVRPAVLEVLDRGALGVFLALQVA
ncbi:hypothetical protein CI238_06474, partial [Colletotrichum incanum]